jgi:hypothetical protein
MIFPPARNKQRLMLGHHSHGTPDVPVAHAALGDDLERDDVNTGFAVPKNMHMSRLMISRIDDEAEAVLAKNCDH